MAHRNLGGKGPEEINHPSYFHLSFDLLPVPLVKSNWNLRSVGIVVYREMTLRSWNRREKAQKRGNWKTL